MHLFLDKEQLLGMLAHLVVQPTKDISGLVGPTEKRGQGSQTNKQQHAGPSTKQDQAEVLVSCTRGFQVCPGPTVRPSFSLLFWDQPAEA